MQNHPLKLALLDFDGTIVNQDIIDLLCDINGKKAESEQLNEAFHQGKLPGIQGLVARINLLQGITKQQIVEILNQDNFLLPGATELFEYFKKHQITTVLASGNILPVLEYYQEKLGIDYIVGSRPHVENDTIMGISESNYPADKPFKIAGIEAVLEKHHTNQTSIMAMGDSPSDKGMFSMAGLKIAINPKGDLAEFADYVVEGDLHEVVEILGSKNQ